ncbi:MAG: hypothetical protein LIO79_07105 [Rikenellaceae bacterium]|nr:hypothetical protein [Rikenellaceae bacterium]
MRKKIFLIFAAAALLTSSCTNNSEDAAIPDVTETKSVYLQVDLSKETKTRSDENTATGTSAQLRSALIYFLDGSADPVIFDIRTVGVGGSDVTLSQIEEGYRFDGIPSSVTQVYVVGNYNSSDTQGNDADFPMTDGMLLSDIQSVVLNIQEVSHGSLTDGTTIDGLYSVMDGRSTITEYDTASNTWNGDTDLTAGDLYANVLISPIVARIEIEEIEYTGSLLSNLTVEGIYINYFYPEAPLSLDLTDDTYINNGSDVDSYDRDNADFAYSYYMAMFDYLNEAIVTADGTTVTPNNEVWAYQVFGSSNPVPHIILKITGITATNGTFIGTRYVTVRGYLDANGTEITEFERNTIYKITNLEFDDDNLEIFPETESQSVWVHVEVTPWVTVIVTPVI